MFAQRTDWRLTPNRWSQALEEHRRRGLPLLDLTESNPTRCGFRYDAPRILEALADPRSLTYQPEPRGLLSAREAVAAYYAERGAKVDPRQIFLTTSTSEAYAYVFRLLADPGDNLLAPSPSYPLFDFLARLNDLELIAYPLVYGGEWQMDLHTLESRITERTRAVLVVHPNNPTGSFVRPGELDFLRRCCAKHSLAIIADEVFADYSWPRENPAGGRVEAEARVASHAATSEVLTFTLSGLSKISALPQMKLAWIVANGPENLLSSALARLEIIADTYLSVAAPPRPCIAQTARRASCHPGTNCPACPPKFAMARPTACPRLIDPPAGRCRWVVRHPQAPHHTHRRGLGARFASSS